MSRIGIDLDGVMADFTGAFSKLAVNLGVTKAQMIHASQVKTWQWPREQQGWSLGEESMCWDVIRQTPNWWMTLNPLVTDAEVDLLNKRMADGIRAVFITSRTRSAGLSVVDQTRMWLAGIGVDMRYVEGIIASKTKGTLARALNLDSILDDKPSNLEDVERHGVIGVARRWPYNIEWPRSVDTVGQFLEEYA